MINDKLYKYYFFYLYDEKNKQIPSLYAYTDDENLAKSFKETRDMNIFILKVHKITRREVNQLAQEYPELYLVEVNGHSKILNDNKYEIIGVSITMTMIERTTIMSGYCEQIYSNLWTKCKFNPLMFQSEIVGALIYIDYFKAYSTYFGSEIDAKLLKLMGEDNMNVYDDYKMDLISVFVYYYGRTMKGMNK